MEPAVAQLLGDRMVPAEADARIVVDFKASQFTSSKEARHCLDLFLQYFGKSKKKVSSCGHWMSYQCGDKDCPFRVSFTRSAVEDRWRVSKLVGTDHNPCSGTFKPTSRFLADLLHDVEPSLLSGPARNMQHYISASLHATVNVRQISRAKFKVLADIDQWDESFTLIPSYVRDFRALNPGSHAAYCVHPGTNVFRGLAVFPDTARVGAMSFKRVWGLDCAHLRDDWPSGRLMLLVAQDWNGQNVVIGAGVVDSESTDNYIWFLQEARQIPSIATAMDDRRQVLAIVSDRGLAIKGALPLTAPRTVQRLCSRHLLGNVKSALRHQGLNLATEMVNGLWALQQACTERQYLRLMNTLRNKFPQAVDYLTTSEDPTKWTDWASPVPIYGIRTSNLVEQENAAFKEEHAAQSPLHVIDDVLKKLAHRITEHAQKARKRLDEAMPTALVPTAATLKREQMDQSANYEVIPVAAARHEFQVRRIGHAVAPDSRQVFISDDLTSYTCTCRFPFHYRMPCRHVFAAANSRNLPGLVIPDCYTAGEHARQYEGLNLRIPDYQELEASDEVRPPRRDSHKRKHGPPKRLPSHQEIPCEGENRRRRVAAARRCSQCHQAGHTKRTCHSKG